MESTGSHFSTREAISKATEICSRSEKCIYDIILKCREWQLSRDETAEVIDYLLKEKFVDQLRYATSFVHDKFRFNKWGKIKLAYALRQKQVEEEYIKEALSRLPAEAYLTVLKDLISAKANTIKDQQPFAKRQKLLAFAQSHGFEVDISLSIIESIR